MLDQAHAYNQLCDVGSSKDGYEVQVLSPMKEDVCKEVSHMNRIALEDAIKHEKISARHNSYRV